MTRVQAWAAAAMVAVFSLVSAQQALRPVLAAPAADPVRPAQRLTDTGLYVPSRPGVVDERNRYFAPQYPLWSDGLSKKRWIYLPDGVPIDATVDNEWRFPVGTRFWKEFSSNGRKIETRLLWKTSDAGWSFASYVWNADGTDAVLAPEEGVPGVVEVAAGRRHSIPSRSDCAACHGTTRVGPLGFNALQLSTDRDPNAIHGEELQSGMLTLRQLVEQRLLFTRRTDLLTNPPRIRTANPSTRAVLGYLSTNCGVCHNGRGEIATAGPTIRLEDFFKNGDEVARNLVGQLTQWQVPGVPDGTSALINPGAPDRSAMLVRMKSRSPSSQMPPLGTVVRDQQAVDAVARWISTDLMRAH